MSRTRTLTTIKFSLLRQECFMGGKHVLAILCAVMILFAAIFFSAREKTPVHITQYLENGKERLWKCEDYYEPRAKEVVCSIGANRVIISQPYIIHK